MPTKPEQGDLEHVLYTSQGDSNRVVFAPGDARRIVHPDAKGVRTRVQLPDSEHHPLRPETLRRTHETVPESTFDREPNPDIGEVVTEEEIEQGERLAGRFKRFRYDGENGVSPRSLPGQKGGSFLASGNEHNEAGHISEDADNRVTQMDRRMEKLTQSATSSTTWTSPIRPTTARMTRNTPSSASVA